MATWAPKGDPFHKCPCCGFRSLSLRGGFEICSVCHWQDDGHGEDDPKVISGGPNGDYSLAEARINFERYCTMFRHADTRFPTNRDYLVLIWRMMKLLQKLERNPERPDLVNEVAELEHKLVTTPHAKPELL